MRLSGETSGPVSARSRALSARGFVFGEEALPASSMGAGATLPREANFCRPLRFDRGVCVADDTNPEDSFMEAEPGDSAAMARLATHYSV